VKKIRIFWNWYFLGEVKGRGGKGNRNFKQGRSLSSYFCTWCSCSLSSPWKILGRQYSAIIVYECLDGIAHATLLASRLVVSAAHHRSSKEIFFLLFWLWRIFFAFLKSDLCTNYLWLFRLFSSIVFYKCLECS